MTKYIGSGQIAVMFAAFGILWCVSETEYTDCTTMLSGCVAAVLLTALLIIPIIILSKRETKSVPEELISRYKAAGKVISFLYIIYFISAAAVMLKEYSEFVSERFFREGGVIMCIILLGIVCVYISHTGAESVCRMSTMVLFLTAVTVIMWLIMGADDMDFSVVKGISSGISMNSIDKGLFGAAAAAAVCMCIICRDNCRRIRKGIFTGLAAFLGASALMILLSCTMLGDYIYASEYPVLDSVIYASRDITFRPDGIYFLLWTIIAAAVVSLLCSCGGRTLKAVIPSIKGEGMIISLAAIVLASVSAGLQNDFYKIFFISPLVPVILIAVIPLILLIDSKRGVRA